MRALRARKLRFCLRLRVSRTRLCRHVLRYHRVAECARGATLPTVVVACCTRPRSMSRNALEVMTKQIGNTVSKYGRLKKSESVLLKRRIRSDQGRRRLARPSSEELETRLGEPPRKPNRKFRRRGPLGLLNLCLQILQFRIFLRSGPGPEGCL